MTTTTGTAAQVLSTLTSLLNPREDAGTAAILKLGDAKRHGEAYADNDSLTAFTKVRITFRSSDARGGGIFTLEIISEDVNTLAAQPGSDDGTYHGDYIWGVLDRFGFDPGFQEVFVNAAADQGEYWAWTDEAAHDGRHVHLTYHAEAETFTVRAAGPECPHDAT